MVLGTVTDGYRRLEPRWIVLRLPLIGYGRASIAAHRESTAVFRDILPAAHGGASRSALGLCIPIRRLYSRPVRDRWFDRLLFEHREPVEIEYAEDEHGERKRHVRKADGLEAECGHDERFDARALNE